jgi:hypothetical protein
VCVGVGFSLERKHKSFVSRCIGRESYVQVLRRTTPMFAMSRLWKLTPTAGSNSARPSPHPRPLTCL